jgi:hypothetical protein
MAHAPPAQAKGGSQSQARAHALPKFPSGWHVLEAVLHTWYGPHSLFAS